MTEFGWHVLTSVLAMAVVVEGLAIVAVLKHLGAVLLRMGPDTYGEVEEGPPIGMSVDPALSLLDKVPGVVVFVSPTCSLCRPLVARLPSLRREFKDVPIVAAVTGDAGPKKDAYMKQIGTMVRGDLDGLYAEWQIPGTPFGVGIGENGLIAARGVVNSVAQVEALVAATTTPPSPAHDENGHHHAGGVLIPTTELFADATPTGNGGGDMP